MAKKKAASLSSDTTEGDAVKCWVSPTYIPGIGMVEGPCDRDHLAEFVAATEHLEGFDLAKYVK